MKIQVWEEMRAVLPEEVTGDWGHFVEIFGRFFVLLPSIVLDLTPILPSIVLTPILESCCSNNRHVFSRFMVNGFTINSWEVGTVGHNMMH